jgi:hypothetical protein
MPAGLLAVSTTPRARPGLSHLYRTGRKGGPDSSRLEGMPVSAMQKDGDKTGVDMMFTHGFLSHSSSVLAVQLYYLGPCTKTILTCTLAFPPWNCIPVTCRFFLPAWLQDTYTALLPYIHCASHANIGPRIGECHPFPFNFAGYIVHGPSSLTFQFSSRKLLLTGCGIPVPVSINNRGRTAHGRTVRHTHHRRPHRVICIRCTGTRGPQEPVGA